MKTFNTLLAISPIDGRYFKKLDEIRPLFSELGLIGFRLKVEIKWLQHLAKQSEIKEIELNKNDNYFLDSIISDFSILDAKLIKDIDDIINHDVKAIEYFLQDKFLNTPKYKKIINFIHFGCTSEDINNLAYGLILKECLTECLLPIINDLIDKIKELSQEYSDIPMLSRTHGQPASPTTMGKEFANFVYRLERQKININPDLILGKINGAVGNFNAHVLAYPYTNWLKISKDFVQSLGLKYNPYTTQIEPHDYIAELFHAIIRFNNILIDFNRDIWGYISIGYFNQKTSMDEVGSSTMPHKINPIDFENAEGNFGMANAILEFIANKLPISRWQRDLSDSTVLRNMGVGIAHTMIAIESTINGLNKLELNKEKLEYDLNDNWEVLGEAIQTVMRKYGIDNPYQKLKEFTRGKKVNYEIIQKFINDLDIPDEAKLNLLDLSPKKYIGIADKLTSDIINEFGE